MSESSKIVGALFVGFMIYVVTRGGLSSYIQVFTGQLTSSASASSGTSLADLSGSGSGLLSDVSSLFGGSSDSTDMMGMAAMAAMAA